MSKKISLIVPCYNEQESLPLFIEEIDGIISKMSKYSFEVIFVIDGSKDNTLNVIKDITNTR